MSSTTSTTVVGIFMLSLLSKKYSSNNIGLYCDDGLSVFRNISGQQAEKHKKIVQKILKDKGLYNKDTEITKELVETHSKTIRKP